LSRTTRITFVAVLLCTVLLAPGCSSSPPTGVAHPSVATSTVATRSAVATSSPSTAAPQPAKSWTKVITMSGSGNKKSATFHLIGGDQRLNYTMAGTSYVCVMDMYDTTLPQHPDTLATEGTPETNQVLRAAHEGDYYLTVTSANCRWTLALEELR
jgi:hypothetical protein